MQKVKILLKKNGISAVLLAAVIILFVSPDAKAWVMRQVMATGIVNAKIDEKPDRESPEESATPASAFAVRDAGGNIMDTSMLRGKVILVNFWASWCPPCRAEFPSVEKLYRKFGQNPHVVFMIVNMDDDHRAGKDFLKKNDYTLPFMVPADHVPADYFQGSLPTTVVLDKKGAVRLFHTGMADYSSDSFYRQMEELIAEK